MILGSQRNQVTRINTSGILAFMTAHGIRLESVRDEFCALFGRLYHL
jgi:hypothetical protein